MTVEKHGNEGKPLNLAIATTDNSQKIMQELKAKVEDKSYDVVAMEAEYGFSTFGQEYIELISFIPSLEVTEVDGYVSKITFCVNNNYDDANAYKVGAFDYAHCPEYKSMSKQDFYRAFYNNYKGYAENYRDISPDAAIIRYVDLYNEYDPENEDTSRNFPDRFYFPNYFRGLYIEDQIVEMLTSFQYKTKDYELNKDVTWTVANKELEIFSIQKDGSFKLETTTNGVFCTIEFH